MQRGLRLGRERRCSQTLALKISCHLGLIHNQQLWRLPLSSGEVSGQLWNMWAGVWFLTQVQAPLGCLWAFILRVAK